MKGTQRGATTRITREAHDGLMRAWLEILRERHPDRTWVAVSANARDEHLVRGAANTDAVPVPA